jgi:hypothetical protein
MKNIMTPSQDGKFSFSFSSSPGLNLIAIILMIMRKMHTPQLELDNNNPNDYAQDADSQNNQCKSLRDGSDCRLSPQGNFLGDLRSVVCLFSLKQIYGSR